MRYLVVLLTLVCLLLGTLGKSLSEGRVSEPILYTGMCGASAGAAVNSDLYIAADDEANQLRVFRRDEGGPPTQVFDLAPDLQLEGRSPQTDIEGAARIGDRVYWITSHSRKSGQGAP